MRFDRSAYCLNCFRPNPKGRRSFCSDACREEEYAEHRRFRLGAWTRECAYCGEDIHHSRRMDTRFCSTRCGVASHRAAA
jgi:predicted nucleic acid-binding Zn ribbon protein